ncbi:MAG TPA: metal ABC transporter ATP-binding protein [Actinomycetota bacterium]|nr:metal ABC transporter ATP-binding protein [Actinomycetota bacterium]
MASAAADPAAPLLAAHGVGFAYGDEAVLTDVDLAVRPREFVALVGPNGAGKSTLLQLLLGVLTPRAGRVELFGSAPSRATSRGRLGYVPQRPALASELPATVREIVTTGRLALGRWWRRPTAADRRAVDHAIESVGLAERADSPLNELSGGQQQRTFIARAFASEPDLLILDEPIAGVDAGAQRRFRDAIVHLIREHGSGVLLVSHELSAVAEDIDRVVVLRRSIVFDGPPSALAAEGVSLGVHRQDLPLWLEELR